MTGENSQGCFIDNLPIAAELANWLRQGLSLPAINSNLERDGHQRLNSTSVSRHRIYCLQLPRVKPGRPQKEIDPASLPKEIPPMEDIKNEMLKIFYWRLKNDPNSIHSKELIPLLNTVLRSEIEKAKPKVDPIDEAMGNIVADA